MVVASVDRLADEWIFHRRHEARRRYVPAAITMRRNQIEVCPQHTWILLLDQVLQWTEQAPLCGRDRTGSLQPLSGRPTGRRHQLGYFRLSTAVRTSRPRPIAAMPRATTSPDACPSTSTVLRDNEPAVTMYARPAQPYSAHKACLPSPYAPGDGFPADGTVVISVEPEEAAAFGLHLRIPPYAVEATVRVGDEAPEKSPRRFPCHPTQLDARRHGHGASTAAMTAQANTDRITLTRGPLTYAYFQDAQEDPMVFHGRRGGSTQRTSC
ncbi:MAG: hypothetical protein R2851_01690 [Caldilineaceae bacterium]